MSTRALESAKRANKEQLRERAVADAMRTSVPEAAARWNVSERSLRRWVAGAKAGGFRAPTPIEEKALEVRHARAVKVRDEALASVTEDLKRLVRMATEQAAKDLQETGSMPEKLIFQVAGAAKILGELDVARRSLLGPGETVEPEPEHEHDAVQNRGVEAPPGPSPADDWH